MRIRKTVSKLLGSSIVYPCRGSPPPTDTWAPPQSPNLLEASDSAIGTSVEVCQLNQSPWDAYPNPELFLRSCKDFESSPILKEEKQEVAPEVNSENNKGILGKSVEKEEIKNNKPLRVCKSMCEKKNASKKAEPNETKKAKKKNEVTLCKKNDGRKWFCKRPAQLPHSFCEYHATQSRSYYSGTTMSKPKKQKRGKAEQDKDTTSNFYYYYDGFGPWRGKKRGDKNGEALMDSCDLPVAGEDEQDDHDDDNGHEIISTSKGNGEKKVAKKRGRKPMKCRSLKSLL